MDGSLLVNLLTNIVANLVSAAVLGLLVIIVVLRTRRRGMRRFFGFRTGRTSLRIHLSTIAVDKAGTQGTADIVEGFHGDAITELEYRHSLALAADVTSGSSSWLMDSVLGPRASAGRIVSKIVLSVPFRPVDDASTVAEQVRRSTSAVDNAIAESACAILVGAPIYNLMTYHTMAQYGKFFTFVREERDAGAVRGIRELKSSQEHEHLRIEDEKNGIFVDYFIIEKISVRRTTVFVCAGTCTSATAAAVDMLRDWRSLFREYGDQDFGVLYRITTPYPHGRETDPTANIELVRPSPQGFSRHEH